MLAGTNLTVGHLRCRRSRNVSSEVSQKTSPATSRPNGSSEVPQRASPRTPKPTHVKKIGSSESEPASSKSTPTKTLIDNGSKVNERRSPRSPVTEKRRPIRVTELEAQIAKLQEDLNKTKDQLGALESLKCRYQQEADDTKAQLSATAVKLEESQRHLVEFSAAEEDRLQELRKISQDRDRAWQTELEATQKQYSADSAALTTAMSEIYRLKQQLELVSKSEAAQVKEYESVLSEFMTLKEEMGETVYSVEELKSLLENSEKAEVEARKMADDTQQQLETALLTVESLHLDGLKLTESLNSKESELQESRARVTFLEETVKKLQAAQETAMKTVESLRLDRLKLTESLNSKESELQESRAQVTSLEDTVKELLVTQETAMMTVESLRLDGLKLAEFLNSKESELQESRSLVTSLEETMKKLQATQGMAMTSVESLRLDGLKLTESLSSKESELQESRARVTSLEETVKKLQATQGTAMTTVESLRLDGLKLTESLNCKESALQESRAQVTSLQETVKKLQATQQAVDRDDKPEKDRLELEVEQLRSALEAAEAKYREEQMQSTIQIRSAFELAERVRVESGLPGLREAELELSLQNAQVEILELKGSLLDKDKELQNISEVNQTDSVVEAKLAKSITDVTDLKMNLLDKEAELRGILAENELLKAEIEKREIEYLAASEAAITDVELARAAEQDAIMRLGCVTEEADKSSRRAASAVALLEAAQAANSEMEAELNRLRVQSNQWRKAAEAATAALMPGNNGQFVERTYTLDTQYQSDAGKLSSPFLNDLGDESPKKKNNVMKKVSGLWKKGTK